MNNVVLVGFQYRKRYEITCDFAAIAGMSVAYGVSIPQAV